MATVAGADGAPYGITANSFTSVSCAPPLVLICVGHSASALPHFRACSHFGINVLDASQRHHSVHFSQAKSNRFEGISWKPSELGVPLLDDVLAQLECSVAQLHDAGDHTILIGEVIRAAYRPGNPLIYFASGYRSLKPDDSDR